MQTFRKMPEFLLCALVCFPGLSSSDFFPKDEVSSKILSGPPQSSTYPNQNPYQPPPNSNYYPDLSGSGSNGNNGNVQNHPSISNVDMQLLAAMEKLVHRMDKLDSRVTTLENVVYYLTNKQKPEKGSCPDNFTRIDGIKTKCYHVSSLYNPNQVYDWKSATTECAKMNARLVEMITFDDFLRISQFLVKYGKNEKSQAATDFWTGGLNPGLIWIWSESGQQVEVDKRFWNENDNGSRAPGCLKMSYSLRLNAFFFKGAPCSQPQNFVCEILNNNIARALANYEEGLGVSTEDIEN